MPSDFAQQFIPIVLFYGVLIAIPLIVYFGFIRPGQQEKKRQKKQQKKQSKPQQPAPAKQPVAAATVNDDDDVLPDLSALLGDSPTDAPQRTSVKSPPDDRSVKLNNGSVTAAQPVLNILRDENDGRLIVQMGGTAYRTLRHSPDAKETFTALMKELSGVIMTPDDQTPPPKPAAPEPAQTSPPPPAAIEPEPAPPPAEGTKPDEAEEPLPGDLPSFRLDDNPVPKKSGIFKAPAADVDVPELNIVDAIEAYLQHKIATTPEFKGRQIHVMQALHGGVNIRVDDRIFEFVDDIDDEATRKFVKDTIEEWQSRQ